MRIISVVCASAVFLAGCASVTREGQISTLVSLTPEHFRDTATLKDDSLEVVAVISTENGYRQGRGILNIVYDDNFLRGSIDKKTGQLTAQLYQRITYQGPWRFYDTANYESPQGVISIPLTKISQNVLSCADSLNGCTVSEDFGFDVPEALLRKVASIGGTGQRIAWKFKFKARNGTEWTDGMVPAEVAGFLMAVDAYRQAHHLPIRPEEG